MKTLEYLFAMSNKVKVVLGVGAFLFLVYSFACGNKIKICHVPPGNPNNCHQIRISINALPAHLNHGDRIVCSDLTQYSDMLVLVGGDKDKLLMDF